MAEQSVVMHSFPVGSFQSVVAVHESTQALLYKSLELSHSVHISVAPSK